MIATNVATNIFAFILVLGILIFAHESGHFFVAIGGDRIDTFDDLRMAISMHAGTPLRVDYLRNGQTHTTTLTPERENSDFGPVGRAGVRPWIDAVVGRIRPDSPAAKSGLQR